MQTNKDENEFTRFTFTISRENHEYLQKISRKAGLPMSVFLNMLIEGLRQNKTNALELFDFEF